MLIKLYDYDFQRVRKNSGWLSSTSCLSDEDSRLVDLAELVPELFEVIASLDKRIAKLERVIKTGPDYY